MHALEQRQLRLVLVTRVRVDDVPLLLGARRDADRRAVAVTGAGAIAVAATVGRAARRLSTVGGVAARSGSVPLSINQLREVRPDEVEQTEDDRREIAMTITTNVAVRTSLAGRPGDLLELGGDLVGEVVDVIVAVHRRRRRRVATTAATSEILNSLGGVPK